MSSVTQELVNFAVDTKFEDLPQEVVREAKRCIMDCIGCALVGITTDKGKFAIQLAKRLGGIAESTIIGAGDKVPATNAAFANGELINAMDFDVGGNPDHSPPCMVSISLALAECMSASGKELILAFVIGSEISARLAAALPPMLKLSETGALELSTGRGHGCCSIGGAANAGKILKLDRAKMSHAFGISAFAAPVPTYTRWFKSPPIPMTKYAFIGWTAMAGVTSALLAETGYTGDTTVLDGEYGFWRFHSNERSYWNPPKVTEQLGGNWRWLVTKRMYKPYPSCGILMTSLGGFIKLIDENKLIPEDIETVRINLAMPMAEEPNSVLLNREIRTGIDAQFSAPYIFAAAAHGIRVSTEWQDLHTINDTKILKFMDKVSVGRLSEHPNMVTRGPNSISYSIEVIANERLFKKEKIYTEDECLLLENTWMPDEDLINKFRDNAAYVLPQPKIDKATSLLLELETVGNVTKLTNCLA